MDLISRIDALGVVGAVVLAAEILGIISAVSAVMSVRTSQGAVAWVVSLITFPYVAVPAYWVFGRNRFHGYVNAYRVADLRAAHPEQRDRDVAAVGQRLGLVRGDGPGVRRQALVRLRHRHRKRLLDSPAVPAALTLPRFRRHARSHGSAVGVCHVETEAASVYG